MTHNFYFKNEIVIDTNDYFLVEILTKVYYVITIKKDSIYTIINTLAIDLFFAVTKTLLLHVKFQ